MIYFYCCMSLFREQLTLDGDEQVLGLFRPHAFFAFIWTIPLSCSLILLFLFMFKFFSLGLSGALFFLVVFLCLFGMLLSRGAAWYGTLYVLTSRRLIAMKRSSLFKKQVTEILLENVSELSYSTKGLIQTVCRFGNLHLTLFGITTKFIMSNIPRPQEVMSTISNHIAKVKAARKP